MKELIVEYISRKNLKYQNLTNDQLMNILEDLDLIEPLLEQMNNTENIGSLNKEDDQEKEFYALNQEVLELESYEYGSGKKSTISFRIKSGRKFKQFPKLPTKTKFLISLVGFNQKAKTQLYSTN